MRGNVDVAEEFVQKMNKAYGVATQTLMQYQATFKNMLSSLGGISEDVSYGLSESLMQMALDYASLYNTSIQQAMTVFQAVLSGQTRPVRSLSGYDITETTIYQLYQELGGTKTMRQLSQTEKRLLRIYAVFQQMDKSGAIGDLNKTLNNTTNQLRVLSESFKELGDWFGQFVEVYIKDYIVYVNAAVILAKDLMKAIVKSLPNYSEFDGTIKGYEETAEAMDEVQGKLLDFDKFRAMNAEEDDNSLGLDTALLTGMQQYKSLLESVNNKAKELAESWKNASDLWVDGEFQPQKLEEYKTQLLGIFSSVKNILLLLASTKLVGNNWFLGAFVAGFIRLMATSEEFRDSLLSILENYKEPLANIATSFLNILNSIVPVVAKVVEFLDSIDALEPTLIAIIGLIGIRKISGYASALTKLLPSLQSFGLQIGQIGLFIAFAATSYYAIDDILSGLPAKSRKVVSIISIIVGALTVLLGVILAIKEGARFGLVGAMVAGLGVGALLAGIKGVSSANAELQTFKTGGIVEDGVFTMNKGEVMGSFDDGTSIVANNQQIISGIKQGVYQAVSQALKANSVTDNSPVEVYIDGEKVFQATKKSAKKHGFAFSKV